MDVGWQLDTSFVGGVSEEVGQELGILLDF